jgi:hypothetical protein
VTAVVAGMIAAFPLGGPGLRAVHPGIERQGFEVCYVEDTDCPNCKPEMGDLVASADGLDR